MGGERGGNYAEVNGLKMYYEIHGTGSPLLLLHGAFMTIGAMGAFVPLLAAARQIIAVELQGHGHTADVDRPLSYERMADVFGYSMGGGAALQLAMRHPVLVRKLVVASASTTSDGAYPEVRAGIEQITPELFAGTPWKEEYDRVAPDPNAFPTLVEKMKRRSSRPSRRANGFAPWRRASTPRPPSGRGSAVSCTTGWPTPWASPTRASSSTRRWRSEIQNGPTAGCTRPRR